MRRIRFQTRTLLSVIALIAISGGAARWWYDMQIREYRQQHRIVAELGKSHVTVAWDFLGPKQLEYSRLDPAFRRPIHAWVEYITGDELTQAAPRLAELTNLETVYILGRQIVPLARAEQSGKKSEVLEALRAHPTLQQIVVDASIRGTPTEFDAPIYTREDLALLEKLLPNLGIEWVEVN